MSHAARILVALGVLCNTAHADYIVTKDHGGPLSQYVARVQGLHASGERVVVDGPCESACTLVLNLPPQQVCATTRGSFAFHGARDAQFGLPSPAGNEELLRVYPKPVRDYIVRNYQTFLLGVIRVKASAFVQPC